VTLVISRLCSRSRKLLDVLITDVGNYRFMVILLKFQLVH
jgi:hypothetical protein